MTAPSQMTNEEQQVAALRADAMAKIREAEKAAYAWFCACQVGKSREDAHEIYSNILYSTRIG